MGRTSIAWATDSWNPVTGCSHVTAGCEHCYAERLSARFGPTRWNKRPWTAQNAAANVVLHADRLELPLTMVQPRRIFVCSMGDLFHELVPDEFIASVFLTMVRAPQHTYILLTKRHSRMWRLLRSETFPLSLAAKMEPYSLVLAADAWPLPNVWVGVSAEDQHWFDQRVPSLMETPAAVRWVNLEPLLGPVDTRLFVWDRQREVEAVMQGPIHANAAQADALVARSLDWVAVGGESGPGYRAMDLDWARAVRDRCVASRVPFFFKQGAGLYPRTGVLLDDKLWYELPDRPSSTGLRRQRQLLPG